MKSKSEISFINEVRSAQRKKKWPSCLNLNIEDGHAVIELVKAFKKSNFRILDSWGLAFIVEASAKLQVPIEVITFVINNKGKSINSDLETFKRRVSFLNINNKDIEFKILHNNLAIHLYNEQELFKRPKHEVVHNKVPQRNLDDKGDRLEKDLQAFLSGKGLSGDKRTNDRLAILGEDFFKSKGKGHCVLREFPTGVFSETIEEKNRITPTEYVDIVTLNKWGVLSIIEIKVDDSALEVISQLLDYALYFRCYTKQLMPILKKSLGRRPKTRNIMCYVANNYFHSRFDGILGFYSTAGRSYGFEMVKLTLGHKEEM